MNYVKLKFKNNCSKFVFNYSPKISAFSENFNCRKKTCKHKLYFNLLPAKLTSVF